MKDGEGYPESGTDYSTRTTTAPASARGTAPRAPVVVLLLDDVARFRDVWRCRAVASVASLTSSVTVLADKDVSIGGGLHRPPP